MLELTLEGVAYALVHTGNYFSAPPREFVFDRADLFDQDSVRSEDAMGIRIASSVMSHYARGSFKNRIAPSPSAIEVLSDYLTRGHHGRGRKARDGREARW
jgi:hypothetical protein